MRRLLLFALCSIALLLVLIVLCSWVRSYYPKNSRLETHNGALHIIFWDGFIPRNTVGFAVYEPGNTHWHGVGPMWRILKDQDPTRQTLWLGFGSVSGSTSGFSYHIFAIPFWFLFILTVALLVLALIALRRHRLRSRLGLCLKCGYDLRESKDKCPECGTAIPASAMSQQ